MDRPIISANNWQISYFVKLSSDENCRIKGSVVLSGAEMYLAAMSAEGCQQVLTAREIDALYVKSRGPTMLDSRKFSYPDIHVPRPLYLWDIVWPSDPWARCSPSAEPSR
jgi:hypothetical protein